MMFAANMKAHTPLYNKLMVWLFLVPQIRHRENKEMKSEKQVLQKFQQLLQLQNSSSGYTNNSSSYMNNSPIYKKLI